MRIKKKFNYINLMQTWQNSELIVDFWCNFRFFYRRNQCCDGILCVRVSSVYIEIGISILSRL